MFACKCMDYLDTTMKILFYLADENIVSVIDMEYIKK